MSLLRYAASGILRNRRRTFSSVLGVLLAVTFIAGTFIAIDSSARATLDATLRSIQGDFNYYGSPLAGGSVPQSNGTDLRDALAAVPGITDVSVYRYINSYTGSMAIYNPSSENNYTNYFGSLLAVDPAHLPYSYRDIAVSGSMNLPNGTLAVDSQTASSLQAKVGDSLVLMSQTWNGTGTRNFTVPFTLGAIVTFPAPSYPYYIGPYPGFYGTNVAVNLRDMASITNRLNLSQMYPSQVQGEIWVNRSRFVNPYDNQATTFQLTRLGRQLNQVLTQTGYSGFVNDNISPALAAFSVTLLIQRVQYLLLSFPVILLGLYLGAVGVDLGHAERRRELGVLKTRGASRRQIALLLISESVLGGLVATVLGLLFGLGLSRILIGAVTPFGAAADYSTVNLTPDTILIVAILSTIFMALVSYRSARRTASLPIIETLRYYAPGETKIHYSPVADIALIGYSVLVYAMFFYVSSSPGNLFILMIGSLLVITLPITPILLIIGSVRLMTRSTGRVYEWTARLIRPFARNLEYIVSRNLSRNPRRSSNIAIIIALGLAFGIFVVSSLGSQQAMQQQTLRANIGADMAVGVPSNSRTNATATTASFEANLTNISGIVKFTHTLPLWITVSPTTNYGSAIVYAIDPSTYFSVAQPAAFNFENPGNPAGAQQVLSTDGQVLITGNFATHAALQIGDPLLLSTTIYTNNTSQLVSVPVHVGGIVRFLPGTFNGYFSGSVSAPDEVYGSFTTLGKLVDAQYGGGPVYGGDRFLVSLKPGVDWKTVKADVLALGTTDVQVYEEQLAQINNNAFLGSFLGFIRMEIAFIVVILTAGLALIIYAASLERTVEFAGITARGSSGWQTAGLLIGEAFSIMLIGVIMGFAVGVLTGYLSVSITTPSFGGGESIVPNVFVFPLDGLILLALAPVAMLGTTVLVAWRIARMNVARVLKMRGG